MMPVRLYAGNAGGSTTGFSSGGATATGCSICFKRLISSWVRNGFLPQPAGGMFGFGTLRSDCGGGTSTDGAFDGFGAGRVAAAGARGSAAADAVFTGRTAVRLRTS